MSGDFLELRLRLYQLSMQGLNEVEALGELLPDESDAGALLEKWKQEGLWPPPEVVASEGRAERAMAGTAALDPFSQRASESEIPREWIERIMGLVTTTVNAAILDYHNFQNDQMESRIESIIDEKLKAAPAPCRSESPGQPEGLQPPPRPRTCQGSRKHVVERAKLQGTCDKALFELFEKDRRTRGFNISQMLDFILFNYYEKPRLSFESTPPSEE